MSEDDLVKNAEREVIEAAEKWAEEQMATGRQASSGTSQRLRIAIYMLQKTRHVTGKIRIADVEAALRENEEKK